VASFLLGLGTFTFVLLMNQIIRLMDLIINKGVGVGVVLRLFLYILPFSLTVTIPMSRAERGAIEARGKLLALQNELWSLIREQAIDAEREVQHA
jgi:hypothetical protein